jgi:hypothetical protein
MTEMKMLPTGKKLFLDHFKLLGKMPTPAQIALYQAFPSKRGFSWTENNEEQFEAVFLEAFVQTFQDEGEDGPHKVYLLVSNQSNVWVSVQVKRITKVIFDICKKKKDVNRARQLGRLFQHMMVGSRVHQMGIEPDRWAVYGFSNQDRIPEWVSAALLV